MIGTAMAILAGSLAAAGGSAASAAMGSHAAGQAAQAQEDSAKYAADLQKQAADNSLAFQKEQYADQQANLAPWLSSGKAALSQLGGSVLSGAAPDANTLMSQDPGYQSRLQMGQQALERAQAAGGAIGSGAALKQAARYGQDYASNEYANAYNRFMQGQTTRYNQLANIAGLGQTANGQAISSGNTAASNIANINTSTANSIGQDIIGAGNAAASGYMGSANAWGSGLSGIGNSMMGYGMMRALFPQPAATPRGLNGISYTSPDINSLATYTPLGTSLGDLSAYGG